MILTTTTTIIVHHHHHHHTNITTSNNKGKALPVLNLAPRHEDLLEEWGYSSTHSLTLQIDGGEWSGSRPSHFTPRERDSGIPG
jgi:hypothetical protein